jgi:hypothetical protein
MLAGGVAVGVLATSGARQQASAAQSPPVGAVKVQRRTLAARVSQAGTLSYRARADGSPYSVVNQARGIYTRLPTAGQVVSQGQALYRVDDRPVVLLHGGTPAFRTLTAGTSGPDVAELNADLVALGYATRAQLDPKSDAFVPASTAGVMRLQAAAGMTQTGALTLGQVVFAEPTAVRVSSVPAQLGGSAQPGETVLQGTSTARQVQLALSAAEQSTMAVGDEVSITLPDDRTIPGVVSSVGAVATCPASSASGSGSSSAAPETDTCSSSGSPSAAPTITVGVTPSERAAAGTWDQAPVQVGVTTASVSNALVVPVNALLAQAGGSYAVEVRDGADAHNHLVPVSLGLFDDAEGLVQVTGPGLAAGEEVVVPAA